MFFARSSRMYLSPINMLPVDIKLLSIQINRCGAVLYFHAMQTETTASITMSTITMLFCLPFFRFCREKASGKKKREKKEKRNSRNGRVTMNREVSENRIFLTKLFVLCGVIMGYDCWINHNRCWWLVFYLTGDIFKCVRVIRISRKQHPIS